MPAEATLHIDYSELLAMKATIDDCKKGLRGMTGAASGGGGGEGGGAGAPIQEGAKGFREWDTQLRHVERTGRGVLALLGVGGGILGVAYGVTREIKNWYAEMEKINKQEAGLGAKIAAAGPMGRAMAQRYGKEAAAAGLTQEQLLDAVEKGNVGEALSRGRLEMGRLRAGAAAGHAAEAAELTRRTAAARESRGALQPGPERAENLRRANAISARELASAGALREAGYSVPAGEGRGVYATTKQFLTGLPPEAYLLGPFWQIMLVRRFIQYQRAYPSEMVVVEDRSAGSQSSGRL